MYYEVELGGTVYITLPTYNSVGVAAAPASLPTYSIRDYDLSAEMANGSGTLALVDAGITGWYFGSHSIAAADGYAAGKEYKVRHAYTVGGTAYADYETILVY